MNNYKLQEIDKNTILLLPIDYQIPLSVIIEDFNMKNEKQNGAVLMDLFIYVGNKKNRYKSFRIKNGQIYLNYSEVYHPDTKIVDAFYNLFAEAPIGIETTSADFQIGFIRKIINWCAFTISENI